MSFVDTILLMTKKKVMPIIGWEASAKTLEAWGVVCAVFLGNASVHLGTYEVLGLLEDANGVGEQLQAQAHRQRTFPSALLRLIQTDFNEIFHQALDRQQRVL